MTDQIQGLTKEDDLITTNIENSVYCLIKYYVLFSNHICIFKSNLPFHHEINILDCNTKSFD